MALLNIIIRVYILLVLVVFVNCGKNESHTSYHETPDEYPQRAGRVKRSAYDSMLDELRINMEDESGNIFHLEWKKQKPFLANEFLPVLTPLRNMNPNVMSDLGEIIMYHDTQQNSAVVFFVKTQTFFGFVGMNHYIRYLPNNFNSEGKYLGEVQAPYFRRYEHKFIHNYDLNFISLFSDPSRELSPGPSYPGNTMDNNIPLEPMPGPSGKCHSVGKNLDDETSTGNLQSRKTSIEDQIKLKDSIKKINRKTKKPLGETSTGRVKLARTESGTDTKQKVKRKRYFLETLIFIASDVVRIFEKQFKEDYLVSIIRHYIIFFNAIDMLFSKMQPEMFTSRLFINIAKIVIEDDILPLPFLNDPVLRFDDVTQKTREYLNLLQSTYPPDSFDYVFISTSRQIWHHNFGIGGATSHGLDMYLARLNNQFHSAVPITVMQFDKNIADYAFATSFVANQFGILNDPFVEKMLFPGQCSSIMQVGGAKCNNCLKWKDKSKEQFKQFIRSSRIKRNYCFLLNKPRSLLPPGINKLISIRDLCECFGYRVKTKPHRWMSLVGGCDKPMQCLHESVSYQTKTPTIIPLDGTPCGVQRICWDGQCRVAEPVKN